MQYPAELPAPIQQGYAIQTVDPLKRTTLDSGRARQRRRFTSVPSMVSVQWIMTTGQAQLFEAWFKLTINDGASWFDMPLKTALGCDTEQVRLTGIYSGPTLVSGTLLRYSAEIEIFERRTINEEWLEFPDYIVNANIIDLAVNREWPAA